MWWEEKYIYSITNKENGKIYFGSARSPEYRYKTHINQLKRHGHPNKSLQKDFDTYGIEAFELKTICRHRKIKGRSNEFIYMEKYKTYDPQYGYNDLDPAMNPVRRKNGFSYRTSPLKGKPCPWVVNLPSYSKQRIVFPKNFNVQCLTEHQRILCNEYQSGKTVREIAEERGVSKQAIYLSIERAIKRFKKREKL